MMFEDCKSLALDKTNLFLLAFLHATDLELTKKRIAIRIKETKIKTSLLSLILEARNKTLVLSIFFLLLSEETRKETKEGRDLIANLTLMTAVTNTRNFGVLKDLGRETKHA